MNNNAEIDYGQFGLDKGLEHVAGHISLNLDQDNCLSLRIISRAIPR